MTAPLATATADTRPHNAPSTSSAVTSTVSPCPAVSKPAAPPLSAESLRESFQDRGEWLTRAHCRSVDPEKLFVKGAEQRKAVAICRHCPVVLQCRADALDNRVEFGVWGGMTERQRRAVLRKHPEITSWADFFAAQLELSEARKVARA